MCLCSGRHSVSAVSRLMKLVKIDKSRWTVDDCLLCCSRCSDNDARQTAGGGGALLGTDRQRDQTVQYGTFYSSKYVASEDGLSVIGVDLSN